MGKTKKLFLLAGGIAFFFTACSTEKKKEPADADVAGADWRTTGLVFADGTITRNGEDTDVLVCVHKTDAAFYYDDAVQTLYDRVEYPQPMEDDPAETFVSISFADLDGDGNSDVRLCLELDEKTVGRQPVWLTWLWNPDTGQYVFSPEE